MNGINESFTQFRFLLYQHFNNRADACLELVDAISADCQASSVPELSLSHLFRRNYSSLYKAIADYEPKEAKFNLAQLSAPFIPLPLSQPFYLLGVDVTPQPRPYAYTLSNRECIYQSQPVKSNKPITFGHAYSSVFALPERKDRLSPHWVIPLSTCRVHRIDKEETGARQVRELLQDHTLPFHERLCVEVTDCAYSKPAYLAANRDQANLITITRSRTNRVFYRQPEKLSSHGRGHALWYGSKFSLRDPQTWSAPDECTTTRLTSPRGKNGSFSN